MAAPSQPVEAKYELLAAWYDWIGVPAFGASVQREAILRLRLRPDDVVFDVGCGTGSAFSLIEQAIGAGGRLIGIDISEAMLARARARIADRGWNNVVLIRAPIDKARLQESADAVLFSFTHDVLQSPEALRHLFQHARPGARVAACGLQWAPWWNLPLNQVVFQAACLFHTISHGLGCPWAVLAGQIGPLDVQTRVCGAVFLATGKTPRRRAAAERGITPSPSREACAGSGNPVFPPPAIDAMRSTPRESS